MPSTKPFEEASRDLAADVAALREDIAKLTASVAALAHGDAAASAKAAKSAMDDARRKFSEGAASAQDRVEAARSDLEAMIERNPLSAVLVAIVAGLLIGMLSHSRK